MNGPTASRKRNESSMSKPQATEKRCIRYRSSKGEIRTFNIKGNVNGFTSYFNVKRSRLEQIVIDELRVCYVTQNNDSGERSIDRLTKAGDTKPVIIGRYRFLRRHDDRFRNTFDVYDIQGNAVATIYFDKYSKTNLSQYFFFKIRNEVLYKPIQLNQLLMLPERMGLSFHNITAIDLAYDSREDLVAQTLYMIEDSSLDTIVNNKVIRNRNEVIKGGSLTTMITRNGPVYPSFTQKQHKAIDNKCEGITVQVYDKAAEIRYSSHKQYILDYYGNPDSLYRWEVRLHNREIREWLESKGIANSIEIINNPSMLRDMFEDNLSSVIRFRYGRKVIKWSDILSLHS